MRALRRLVLLLLGCAGCSLVIDGELISVHCDDEGVLGPPACPARHRCVDHTCVSGHAAAPGLGSRCGKDGECAEGDLCLDPMSFGAVGPTICSRACCSSSDCGESGEFVCWSPVAGGGNFCVSAAGLGRSVVGTHDPAVRCDTPGDCRSGVCTDGRCEDPCCSDTNCAAAHASCQFGIGTSPHGFTCDLPASGRMLYDACSTDDQCASGLCLEIDGALRCSTQCCSSSDCSPMNDGMTPVVCDYVPHAGGLVRACAMALPEVGEKVVGDACDHDKECRSARCVKDPNGDRACGDVCCRAADCRDQTLFACVPRSGPGGEEHSSALRCERK